MVYRGRAHKCRTGVVCFYTMKKRPTKEEVYSTDDETRHILTVHFNRILDWWNPAWSGLARDKNLLIPPSRHGQGGSCAICLSYVLVTLADRLCNFDVWVRLGSQTHPPKPNNCSYKKLLLVFRIIITVAQYKSVRLYSMTQMSALCNPQKKPGIESNPDERVMQPTKKSPVSNPDECVMQPTNKKARYQIQPRSKLYQPHISLKHFPVRAPPRLQVNPNPRHQLEVMPLCLPCFVRATRLIHWYLESAIGPCPY